jgi:hypothetical protein
VAFSPDGKTILTGCDDGLARFFSMAELPDDPERAAAWIEVLTGLTLDARRGSIHILDNAAWRASRARLERLGGPPETVHVGNSARSSRTTRSSLRSRPGEGSSGK